jgi:hypothetical protein
LNQIKTTISITNQTWYNLFFLTNLEDEIIFKGVGFVTLKIVYKE